MILLLPIYYFTYLGTTFLPNSEYAYQYSIHLISMLYGYTPNLMGPNEHKTKWAPNGLILSHASEVVQVY